MDDTVLDLLDDLERIIDKGKHAAFSNKIQVDKDELFDIIGEIRMRFPNEFKQSKRIIEDRNRIMDEAQSEANELLREAEEALKKMVNETEITKRAYEQASEIVDASKQTAKEMRFGANEYADEMLALTEENMRGIMEAIANENARIQGFFNQSLNILYENRQELQENLGRRK